MTADAATQLELLAEMDALSARLRRWADAAPDWQPAEVCRPMIYRLLDRTAALRLRMSAPLVVATLGGTGTGKSALVNALVGREVVATGRQRPTTARPTLVCRPDITPELLGMDPAAVDVVVCDAPALRELVLLDCPDPDTTEEADDEAAVHAARAERKEAGDADPLAPAASQPQPGAAATNLARLRRILPQCDVLLVTTTQQKYRSARVAEELRAAAEGARLVFVVTHADEDEDIRDDWRAVPGGPSADDEVFRLDSLAALADATAGRPPSGDFAALLALLTRAMAGAAQARIRRSNWLELAAGCVARCGARIERHLPAVEAVEKAAGEQRARLTARLAADVQAELVASRRLWEGRLLDRAAARWGFSPFALVLRTYQGLGGLVSGWALWRARTPVQLALWGAVAGVRSWRRRGRAAQATLVACWDQAELRSAGLVLAGYAAEAGLPQQHAALPVVTAEAARAEAGFVAAAAGQISDAVERLAARHTRWPARCLYESLLLAMLGVLLYRLGKNFFYDSWLAPQPVPVHGLDFYLAAGFWLLLWCVGLVWAFLGRLRRGLRREIDRLAQPWAASAAADGLFATLADDCRRATAWHAELRTISAEVARLRADTALQRRTEASLP